MRVVARRTLSEALELGPREVIALLGGGGKSSALRVIAAERATAGDRLIVTTTTAMFETELASVGPLRLESDDPGLATLKDVLRDRRVATVAASRGPGGKVVGVDPATVDELWSAGTVDSIIVEADGSRGRSLKTFAAHEPRLPSATTTAVLVAGLDVVGEPLTDAHVHRADAFAATLGCATGSELTPSVVADALRDQTAAVRRLSASRVVVLLNKLDVRDGDTVARRIAAALMPRTDGNDGAEDADRRDTPDGLVVASLAERRYNAVEAARG